jgi:hypothetical protein
MIPTVIGPDPDDVRAPEALFAQPVRKIAAAAPTARIALGPVLVSIVAVL